MGTLAQTWAWLQGPLRQTLFPPAPYYAGGAANYSEVASHLVLGQLALVGAVRIKQWRVRPDVSCPPRLPGFARPCYGVLRAGAEASVKPFLGGVSGDEVPHVRLLGLADAVHPPDSLVGCIGHA